MKLQPTGVLASLLHGPATWLPGENTPGLDSRLPGPHALYTHLQK